MLLRVPEPARTQRLGAAWSAVGLALGAALGCQGILGIEDWTPLADRCVLDEHCAGDEACIDGVCRTACTGDGDCDAGETCSAAGVCGPAEVGPDAGGLGDAGPDASGAGGAGGTDAGGGTGGADAAAVEAIGTAGEPCAPNGALGCAGHAQKAQLVCVNGLWQPTGACSGSDNCDTTPGASTTGTCQPIIEECTDKAAGDAVCRGRERFECGPDLLTREAVQACEGGCVQGACTPCHPGDRECSELTPRVCDSSGSWQDDGPPCLNLCTAGECTGVCTPTSRRCKPDTQTPQICDAAGAWQDEAPCPNACSGGDCAGTCVPESRRCNGLSPQVCDSTGSWTDDGPACLSVCEEPSATCDDECVPESTQCSGDRVQTCDASGEWGASVACEGSTPFCYLGACTATPPSCHGLAADCGAASESCCTSPLVDGGTFNRGNDASYPATVSSFRLDKYVVTVGRFRKFVDAYVAGWRPASGSGKHVHLAGGSGLLDSSGPGQEPGWNTAWTTADAPYAMHSTREDWDAHLLCMPSYHTWETSPGSSTVETRPINCINWYQAYAFCIWDGGFLPSEAEWNYAAAGGSEQRPYPWGSAEPEANTELAVYGCYYETVSACSSRESMAPVGTAPDGNGRYGQADLAGNIMEWNLDAYSSQYAAECIDCAHMQGTSSWVMRGGAFASAETSDLLTSARWEHNSRDIWIGFRCARSP